MAFQKCECIDCSQPIEYPIELCGHVIECPNCTRQLILPVLEQPNKPGLISGFFTKLSDARQRSKNKKEFKQELISAVGDGVLTDFEVAELLRRKSELELTEEDIRELGLEIFEVAVRAVKTKGHLSPQSHEELCKIQAHLGLHDSQLGHLGVEIVRSRQLHELQRGNIAPINAANVILQPGEFAYWIENGTLHEQKVVSRRYEGGSRGASIRVMKGVSFRVGASRGQVVSETGWIPVSVGNLVITNQRIIFQGDRKSFATKYEKIFEIQPAMDGLRFSESNRQKPRAIMYRVPNGDYVCEILSYFIEKRTREGS